MIGYSIFQRSKPIAPQLRQFSFEALEPRNHPADFFSGLRVGGGAGCAITDADNGSKGTVTSLGGHVDHHALVIDPTSGGSYYVLDGTDGGPWLDTPGGTSTDLNTTGLQLTQIYGLTANPDNPSQVLAGSQDNNNFVRTSGNLTWHAVTDGDGSFTFFDPNTDNAYVTQTGNLYTSNGTNPFTPGFKFNRPKPSPYNPPNNPTGPDSLGNSPAPAYFVEPVNVNGTYKEYIWYGGQDGNFPDNNALWLTTNGNLSSSGSTWTKVGNPQPVTQGPITLQTGGSLADGTTYYYVVTPTTSGGELPAGNEENTGVITGTNQTAIINWAPVTGATGYNVYRGTSPGGENLLVATLTSGNTTTFADTGTSITKSATPPRSTWPSVQTTYSNGFLLDNNAVDSVQASVSYNPSTKTYSSIVYVGLRGGQLLVSTNNIIPSGPSAGNMNPSATWTRTYPVPSANPSISPTIHSFTTSKTAGGLYTGSITVQSGGAAGFPKSGNLFVETNSPTAGAWTLLSYTGISGNVFTGVSSYSGSPLSSLVAAGQTVGFQNDLKFSAIAIDPNNSNMAFVTSANFSSITGWP